MDPDNQPTSVETVSQLAVPTDGWQGLIQAFGSTIGVFSFTHAKVISYFVTRTADDGLPMGTTDVKGRFTQLKFDLVNMVLLHLR